MDDSKMLKLEKYLNDRKEWLQESYAEFVQMEKEYAFLKGLDYERPENVKYALQYFKDHADREWTDRYDNDIKKAIMKEYLGITDEEYDNYIFLGDASVIIRAPGISTFLNAFALHRINYYECWAAGANCIERGRMRLLKRLLPPEGKKYNFNLLWYSLVVFPLKDLRNGKTFKAYARVAKEERLYFEDQAKIVISKNAKKVTEIQNFMGKYMNKLQVLNETGVPVWYGQENHALSSFSEELAQLKEEEKHIVDLYEENEKMLASDLYIHIKNA